MPSDRVADCFRDILGAIDRIEAWVRDAGGARSAVLDDERTRSAVERQVLILSEAGTRLHRIDPELSAKLAPAIDWRSMRGMGNFIRHRYDDLDTQIIMDVLQNRLGPLRRACAAVLDPE